MAVDSQQKSPAAVYRAGTKSGPSFKLKDPSIDEVWLVTSLELFFPHGQDNLPMSSQKSLKEICLWTTDGSNLREDFKWSPKYDGVIRVELNDSRGTKNPVKEIQTRLKSLVWKEATVPQCKGGFSLMNLSPFVQAIIVYMKDNFPIKAEELNFHAELKAVSQWCCSDDYKHLVLKEVPVSDCRLKIAACKTLKTWEKKEKDLKLQMNSDSCDDSVGKQLSDYSLAIGVLKDHLGEDLERSFSCSTSTGENDLVPKDMRFQQPPKVAACEGAMAPALHANTMEEHPSAAGTKSPQNGSPKKRKHKANGDGNVPVKRVKPAQRRVSPRRKINHPCEGLTTAWCMKNLQTQARIS